MDDFIGSKQILSGFLDSWKEPEPELDSMLKQLVLFLWYNQKQVFVRTTHGEKIMREFLDELGVSYEVKKRGRKFVIHDLDKQTRELIRYARDRDWETYF